MKIVEVIRGFKIERVAVGNVKYMERLKLPGSPPVDHAYRRFDDGTEGMALGEVERQKCPIIKLSDMRLGLPSTRYVSYTQEVEQYLSVPFRALSEAVNLAEHEMVRMRRDINRLEKQQSKTRGMIAVMIYIGRYLK